MYNGIGLSSVRGSGTSGYVQANAFNRHRKGSQKASRDDAETRHGAGTRGPNEEVLAHNRKRQLELKVFEYRVELEDEELPEEEIERRVDEYRSKLLREEERQQQPVVGSGTHEAAARKQHDMEKLQDAFGVGTYEEGAAFTKEYHEKKKQEREQERLARQKAREEAEERRREEIEARERARDNNKATSGEDDAERDRQARELALDDELDRYQQEALKRNRGGRDTSDGEGGREDDRVGGASDSDGVDRGQPAEDRSEEFSDEAPRKRARHDTDSEHDDQEEQGEQGEQEEQGEQGEEAVEKEEEDGEKRVEEETSPDRGDAARNAGVATGDDDEPAQVPAATSPKKDLEAVILALFVEKDTLRKKEVVAAAEEAGVDFQDGEYSKLMRKHATSQPGGKWKKNGL